MSQAPHHEKTYIMVRSRCSGKWFNKRQAHAYHLLVSSTFSSCTGKWSFRRHQRACDCGWLWFTVIRRAVRYEEQSDAVWSEGDHFTSTLQTWGRSKSEIRDQEQWKKIPQALWQINLFMLTWACTDRLLSRQENDAAAHSVKYTHGTGPKHSGALSSSVALMPNTSSQLNTIHGNGRVSEHGVIELG